MSCTGVQCAVNATCFPTGAGRHVCKCNSGYVGDGVKKCHLEPFQNFTLTLVLIIALFCILVALLYLISYKHKFEERKKTKKKIDPYSINWYAYIKEWKNTTIRNKGKSRKPLEQNGGHYIDPTSMKEKDIKNDEEGDLPIFKIDDATVKEQKMKLQQASRSNSIRIDVTNDDSDEVGVVVDQELATEGNVGVDNPVYVLQQQDEVNSKYDNHEEISLSSFKPTQEVQGLHAERILPPERPPPYTSKHSFKESRKSPRIKPKIEK